MNDFLQSIRNQSKDKRYQHNNRPRRPYDKSSSSGSGTSGTPQSQHHSQQQQYHNQQNSSTPTSNYHRNDSSPHHRNNDSHHRNDGHRNKYQQRPRQDFGQRDENLGAIKELLESMVAHQAQTLEIHSRRADAEERKAEAIEDIASIITSLAGADFSEMDKVVSSLDAVTREFEGELDLDDNDDYFDDEPVAKETKSYSKDEIISVIQKMRQEGSTYNEVAAHLTNIGLPTFSGRGKWHAQTIHRLCQQD